MTDTTTIATQVPSDSRRVFGGEPNPHPTDPTTAIQPSGGGWDELRTWASMLEDVRKSRISAGLRVGSGSVDPDVFLPTLDLIGRNEKHIKLELRRCYRRVVPEPIRQWQKDTHGIGEPGLSLLLGITGDPAVAEPYRWEGTGTDRVLVPLEPYRRTLRQWYSYCGWGDPTRQRRKGMTDIEAMKLGNQRASVAAWNLGAACVQLTRSAYRPVYDEHKARYQQRVDDGAEGWTQARAHNAALRVTIKAILRDIWQHAQQ